MQETSDSQKNLSISVPKFLSFSLTNTMRKYSQAPEHFIKVLKPVVLSVSLRNKYNRLNPPQEDSVFIPPPTLTDIGIRPLLQNLQTEPLDTLLYVTLPNITKIHKKGFLNAYDNRILDELRVFTPEFLWAEIKNAHNSHTQRDDILEIGLPNDIEIGGSVKPVLTFPVLNGTEDRSTVSNILFWSDASITHTGYTLYKSLEPIPVDTTQESYKQLGRNVKQFFDYDDIPLNTPVYYRVTPRSVHGNLFSNQVEITHYTDSTGDTDDIIYFMIQECPTYIPIRADNNIIPLVPIIDTIWNELDARFEQFSVLDSTLTSEYIPALLDIKLCIYGVNTTNLIYFMVQESSTYIPLRVDNNIIPLVSAVNTSWDGLNARFEQMDVLDTSLTSDYTPTPLDIDVRAYITNLLYFMIHESPSYIPLRVDNNIIPLVPTSDTNWKDLNARFEQMAVQDMTLVSEYIPTPTNIEMRTYTANLITFMLHDSPTYTPLRVDNNIIPLVVTTDTMWNELNAGFEQLAAIDADIVSEYTPAPLNIEMRTYDE